MASRNHQRALPGVVRSLAKLPMRPLPPVQPPTPPVDLPPPPPPISSYRVGARLHIGCGPLRLKYWINADAAPGIGEVVLDLHDKSALPASTFAVIYGCHVLEHCWPQDTPGILRRLHDALLPAGTLRLSVPDVRLVIKNCLDSHAYGDEQSALAVLYGGDFSRTTAAPDLHRQAFWQERLERLLTEAGFVNIRQWGLGQYPEIDALGDYATRPRGPDGRSLISLNLEADRPGRPGRAAAGPAVANPSLVVAATSSSMDVSVLLGTVDRPTMLRQCVESVRASLAGSGFSHEIVVAYGREDEPALPWMRAQPDVVRVLGGMDGAIEALNRAYAVSRGRLVCQINDDVVIDGDAIARAARHLDKNLSCAGVVFKFDRNDGLGYRHEWLGGRSATAGVALNSPATLHPNQMVVRRETCEAIVERIGAFWGDRERRTDKTYGGDSAFGVICRHLGLRLDSVDGVTCRDRCGESRDALRAANAKVDPLHAERWRLTYLPLLAGNAAQPSAEEWPNLYVPRPGSPARRSPVAAGRPLRLLHLSLSYEGEPQNELRGALARIGPTVEVPWYCREREVLAAASGHRPDVVWAQIQSDAWKPEFTDALRAAVGRHCTICLWTGDVRTSGSAPVEKWMAQAGRQFDLFLADGLTYPRKLAIDERSKASCGYLQCGIDPSLNRWDPDAVETGGIVFLGSPHGALDGGANARERLLAQVNRALPGALTVYGSGWNDSQISTISKPFVDQGRASSIMRAAAVTISTSLFQDLARYSSDRLKRAMASGAVAAVHRFPDMEGLGLRDGENCLVWSNVDDLTELLKTWTLPERAAERLAIRARAAELAHRRFTWATVVEEFLAIVREYRARRGHR